MTWIADAITKHRSSILDDVEATLRDATPSSFTAQELIDQAAWTLDLLITTLRDRSIDPLFTKWEAIGGACAQRDLSLEELPTTPDLLKRAIWRQLVPEVGSGAVEMNDLVDAMMEVEEILADCRYAAAKSYLETRDVATVARNERVEALYSLVEILSGKGDGDSYTHIADKIASITGIPRCSILLADDEGLLRPSASNYVDALEMLKRCSHRLMQALSERLAGGAGPVVLEKDKGSADLDALLGEYHTPLVLAVPMISGEKLVGVVLLDAQHDGEFTSKQVDLATACSSQAALAIEKSALLAEMESRLKQMAAIGVVARSLTTHLDPKEQLDSLLQMATTLMRADSGVFMLVEEMFGELKREASAGTTDWAADSAFIACARWVFDHTMITAWHKGESDDRFGDLPAPLTACLTAPLMVRDKAIGIISVASRKVGERFATDDMELFSNFSAQAAVALENTQLYERLQDTYLGAIGSLAAAIEARDPYTVGHSARVTQYAVAIAESMQLPSEEVEDLRLAGLLHDLGKIGVPDSILNKAGRLSDEEYSAIKMHPALSMRIIEPLPHLGNIIPIIYHHHERYDGNGYMDGKAGEKIPLGARIIAVADSYEAMTSDRPYRKALSREEAVAEIGRNAGSQFDPEVVKHFLALLEKTAPAA